MEASFLKKIAQNKKITKYKRYSFFNIGTLLFGTVFIYMIITMFMYLTETHVTSYEVTKGTITGNYRFYALSLRTENIVTASQSGSIRYYEREGSKASSGSVICSINETGSVEPALITDFKLGEDDASRLQETLSTFTINYSGSLFQKTYDLKASIEGTVSAIIEESSASYTSVRNPCTASESGFVIYQIDGFETVAENDLTADMFDQTAYSVTNLRNQENVSAGSPVFKLVTDETWALYFQLDDKLATELADSANIRFRFLKDNVTFTAPFSIVQNGQEKFGKISLDNSLVRYVTDRFLEVELVMNKKSGLKIPVSSIVKRRFYKIPEDYAITNDDSNEEIVLKVESFAEDGSSVIEYVTANVYQYEDGEYLVDYRLLEDGVYILLDDTNKKIQLGDDDVETLHGVYNINKGYAVFREITVIDENEEYCIVESNSPYGLAAYDYIVLNADEVTEDQIVY